MNRKGKILAVIIFTGLAIGYLLKSPLVYSLQGSLEPYSRISSDLINESSGIVKSRNYDNVYWTHNDSGDKARIFAIRLDGSLIQPDMETDYEGISIKDAKNIDWEDITTDDQGNLYIGNFGNNANKRKNLSIYKIKEPNPYNDISVKSVEEIKFHFPDQKDFPPDAMNFDIEAMFYANNNIYILSKHRADTNTKLYRISSGIGRLDTNSTDNEPGYDPESSPLEYITEFPIGGMVTAADASLDFKSVAILTYTNIWYFNNKSMDENFFDSEKHYMNLNAKQCEAVCFNGEDLIITNEQRDMYSIEYKSLPTK